MQTCQPHSLPGCSSRPRGRLSMPGCGSSASHKARRGRSGASLAPAGRAGAGRRGNCKGGGGAEAVHESADAPCPCAYCMPPPPPFPPSMCSWQRRLDVRGVAGGAAGLGGGVWGGAGRCRGLAAGAGRCSSRRRSGIAKTDTATGKPQSATVKAAPPKVVQRALRSQGAEKLSCPDMKAFFPAPALQVMPVELPGRNSRAREAPITDLPALAAAAAEALLPLLQVLPGPPGHGSIPCLP